MPPCAIRVEGLAKHYHLGQRRNRARTLRDAIAEAAMAPVRNLQRLRSHGRVMAHEGDNVLWALRDVAFEVDEGEVVGVIGKNGAGKTTLLKILSRIVAPTAGYAEVVGRVGSLLEVGTGFHPELTGRDNVYLNGSVLGMDRRYIDARFDEIVEFSGVERFIDTPVKHYSSGMYLRLAFAVAAHLNAEILMVDEVLAVGDIEFQKKCLTKMSDIAGEGRTILFVSHDLNAIQRMCSRSLLFEGGRLVEDGTTTEVLRRYLRPTTDAPHPRKWIDLRHAQRTGNRAVTFEEVQYSSGNAEAGYEAYSDGPLELRMALGAESGRSIGSLAVYLFDQRGMRLILADTMSQGLSLRVEKGRTEVGLRISALHLNPGTYRLGLRLYDPLARKVLDRIEAAFDLEVIDLQTQSLGRKRDAVVTCAFELFDATESGDRA